MKLLKSALELLAFLQVIFAIYGICGAYEQNYIDGMQFAEYLLIFCITLTVNIIAIKVLTAAIELKNDQFKKSESNRTKDGYKPRFYHITKL